MSNAVFLLHFTYLLLDGYLVLIVINEYMCTVHSLVVSKLFINSCNLHRQTIDHGNRGYMHHVNRNKNSDFKYEFKVASEFVNYMKSETCLDTAFLSKVSQNIKNRIFKHFQNFKT